MDDYSDILFARPSFIEGVARSVDLGGTLQEYNYSRNGEAADRRALSTDFRAIGRDIRQAFQVAITSFRDDSRHEG